MCLNFTTLYEAHVLMQEEMKGLFEYHHYKILTLYTDMHIYILYT